MAEPTFEPTTQDLQIIRDWIKQNPYLPQDYEDKFLAAFFKASKGSLQKTKIVLENYCALGGRYPDMYAGLDPDRKAMTEYLEVSYFYELPQRIDGDTRVIITSLGPGPIDISKHHVLEVFRLQLISMLLAIKDDIFGTGKLIIVTDCKGASLAYVHELTPTRLSNWTKAVSQALPTRLQGVHGVNVPPALEYIFNVIKIVAKKKIGDRVHLHSKNESLQSHIPKEMLPAEYGGTASTSAQLFADWKKRMAANKEYLIAEEERNRKFDSIRPKDSTETEMSGTFKQLNVD